VNMSRTLIAGLVLFFAGCTVGCGGTVLGKTKKDGPPATPDAGAGGGSGVEGAGGRGTDAGPALSHGSGGAAIGMTDASAGPPPDLKRRATTWIGQTETPVTYPLSDGLKGPQKVVLILGAVADADAVGGSVTFGNAPPPPKPTDPAKPYPPNGGSFPESLLLTPYAGFSYTLLFSDLKQNHLMLTYNPSELFKDWCAIQKARPGGYGIDGTRACECTDTECHHLPGPTRKLDLVIAGDAMQGEQANISSDSTLPIQIRLRRVD